MKTKSSQITSGSMVKENGETFPKEQVGSLSLASSLSLVSFCLIFLNEKLTLNHCSHLCVGGHAGLNRCGKSCRLRWLNYLRPDIKRGNISSDEEELIIRLHKLLGNRYLQLHILQFNVPN